jgi:hypothetical protein
MIAANLNLLAMFYRVFAMVILSAAVIVLLVAGTGWTAVEKLHETSKLLVVDTLPSLVDAGLVEQRIHQNRDRMRALLQELPAAGRAEIIRFVTTNTTDRLWCGYAAGIYAPDERRLYQAMLPAESGYNQTLPPLFDLVAAGKLDAAAAWFYGEQSRRFQTYDAAVKQVFAYHVQQGLDRGKNIRNSLGYAPWAVAGVCALVFIGGLGLGRRFGLGGGKAWPPDRPV